MPRSFSTTGLILPADSEDAGVWGQLTNTNMQILSRLTSGTGTLALTGTASTLTVSDGLLSDGQYAVLILTGSLSGTHTITVAPNDADRVFHVLNATGEAVVITQGAGGDATVPAGGYAVCSCDGAGAGARVRNLTDSLPDLTSIDGVPIGTTTPASGAFTTVSGTGEASFAALDNTPIGGTTPAAGAFTTVTSTGEASFASLNNTPIGGTTPAAGTFSTLTATSNIVAPQATITAADPVLSVTDTSRNITFTVDTSDGLTSDPEAVLSLTGVGLDTFSRFRVEVGGVDVASFLVAGGEGILQVANVSASDEINAASLGASLQTLIDARADARIAAIPASGIGVGQTWQDVSGSRAMTTSYQNTTGAPIMWGYSVGGDGQTPEVSDDNSTWVAPVGTLDANGRRVTIIVPDDHYYRVTGAGGVGTWTELR